MSVASNAGLRGRFRPPANSSPIWKAAAKPASEWRVGTEHEKFLFRAFRSRAPVVYDGNDGVARPAGGG